MLLSIVIPAFDVEASLPRCLDSILGLESDCPLEIVLVDDGSGDGTGAICDAYAARDTRVRAFHRPKGGVSAARNFGLEQAKGDLIWFVDGDDQILPEQLPGVLERMASDPAPDLICFGFRLHTGRGKQDQSILPRDGRERLLTEAPALYYGVLNGPGYVWNKIFRRSLLEDLRFREDLRYGEDTLFVAQALRRCRKAALSGALLYRYDRGRAGNTVSAGLDERSLEYLRANREVWELYRTDCPSLGVSRCLTAARTVLAKGPAPADNARYLRAVRETLRFRLGTMLGYLRDRRLRESRKQRLSGLLAWLAPGLVQRLSRLRRS